MWTGLVWLRIGTGGECGIKTSGSIKCCGTIQCPKTRDPSRSAQLHEVRYI
jgi:hypothetical protein